MSAEAVQHNHQLSNSRPKYSLNLPSVAGLRGEPRRQLPDIDIDRRGSTESAYYSIYSDGDRRGSWQDGEAADSSAGAVAAPSVGGASAAATVRRASSSSALCEECELRRFRPADRSPFHTRLHAEAVMAEFASLHGERVAAAAALQPPPATVAQSPQLLAPPPPLPPQPHSPHCPVSPSASVDPLPTLAEEDASATAEHQQQLSVSMTGRLNTVSSCDLSRRNRRLASKESTTAAASTASSSSSSDPMSPGLPTNSAPPRNGGRKFSLDASTVTTPGCPGRPAHLLRRPSVGLSGGASGGGLFRLFHHEATPEELEVFNQSRRSSKTEAENRHQLQQPDQNPSALFRRFQSTDDDYFVALKVEEPPTESLPVHRDRQKLLSVGDDGSTIVTELSDIPELSATTPSTETSSTTAVGSADDTDGVGPSSQTESEIEIALRLAKTSPFAYVPPAKLRPAPVADCQAPDRRRPSFGAAATVANRRDTDWRRCPSELSKTSRSLSTGAGGGRADSGIAGFGGGSRVKQLMARFGDGK